jgi:hypothetical protein
MLLSSAYFPNIHYFTKVIQADSLRIEATEHYIKQSYRNRCSIYAANGVTDLTIPIIKGRSRGILMRDIRIDYAMPWQRNHLRSIHSAYSHSPFYEFYVDDLAIFFENKERFLLDHNYKIFEILIGHLEIQEIEIKFTDIFEKPESRSDDWRYQIHPKLDFRMDPSFKIIPYSQTFEQKKGFQPNLSILDTLFQLGPETLKYIEDCTVKT